jgi:hypothetical protein
VGDASTSASGEQQRVVTRLELLLAAVLRLHAGREGEREMLARAAVVIINIIVASL